MRWLLLAAAVSVTAGSAAACLNDATLKGSEREFRSQYQSASPTPAATPDTSAFDRDYLLRGLAGGGLILGAIALAFRHSSPV